MYRLTPSDESKIAGMSAAGKSLHQIAKEIGFSHTACRNFLLRRSLPTGKPTVRFVIPERRAFNEVEIARMKAAGLGIRPIAQTFGVCDATVRRSLKRSHAIQSMTDKCASSKILPRNEARRIFGIVHWDAD